MKELTFNAVDELAFASTNGKVLRDIPSGSYLPAALGPLVEFLVLMSEGVLPDSSQASLDSSKARNFLTAWYAGQRQWLSQDAHIGFIHTGGTAADWDIDLTRFLMAAQRAARERSQLPGTTPGQMAAAMQELEGNIQEHSNAVASGVLVFRATDGVFEFVVADRGIGLLDSLRQRAAFAALHDHGRALELALTDGTSRYDDARRGHGFRPIFIGLTNLQGYLRFRSGDHALVMDGTGPTLATAHISQKPLLQGFFASVRCHNRSGSDAFVEEFPNEQDQALFDIPSEDRL